MPVINEAADLSEAETLKTHKPPERLKPFKGKELRTKREIMKCKSTTNDVLAFSKTKFNSGKGGAGGTKGFPQDELEKEALRKKNNRVGKSTVVVNESMPIQPAQTSAQSTITRNTRTPMPKLRKRTVPNDSFRKDGIPRALSETIAAIQNAVQQLSWPIEQLNSFIARKFHGQRRSQLSDEELIELLYHLQVQRLESVQVDLSKTQNLGSSSLIPIS